MERRADSWNFLFVLTRPDPQSSRKSRTAEPSFTRADIVAPVDTGKHGGGGLVGLRNARPGCPAPLAAAGPGRPAAVSVGLPATGGRSRRWRSVGAGHRRPTVAYK